MEHKYESNPNEKNSRLSGSMGSKVYGTSKETRRPEIKYDEPIKIDSPSAHGDAVAVDSKEKFCPGCGYAIEEGTRFCSNCGHSLSHDPHNKLEENRSHKEMTSDRGNTRRISPIRELMLLIAESGAILVGETRNLLISVLFPLAAAAVTVWIAGENMFVNCESTKSACFILVCAAIWGGLFNSIQTIVKERDNIKRDYMSGALRLSCYMSSRAIVQLVLCALQSAVLCISFYGVYVIYENDLPAEGVIFSSAMIEYYITVFLIMYAADTMGLMISCFVKSEQLASQFSPYILIVQLLFSGVLFAMEGAASGVSALMLSRWGMEALGSISNLNELPLRLQEEFPVIPHDPDDAFIHTAEHLQEVWLVLLVFVVLPLVIGTICLHGVKKDSRE